MEPINKMDIAKDIVERMIAMECKNGVDENNPVLQELIVMKDEIYKNNTALIDSVIAQYKQAIVGENNGNKDSRCCDNRKRYERR